jgi:hypothetical protein
MNQNPNRPEAGRVSGKEMADTLAEVLRDQNEKAKGWQKSPDGHGRRKTSPFTWVVLFAGLFLSGFVWFAPPSWLDPSPTPLSPALTEAGLRMEVFQQALLVKQFLENQGRLPDDLAEAGAPYTEVGYQKIDAGRYRLTLFSPVASVEYLSTDSLETFLGNSLQIIRQGG